MPEITIREYLSERNDLPAPGDDHDLERRLYLEDRIRKFANRGSLGPEFIGLIFTQSNFNLRGQEKVDFGFKVSDALDRAAETERLRGVVARFMDAVKK